MASSTSTAASEEDGSGKKSECPSYPRLLSPLKKVGHGLLELPNRVIMAPMTRGRSEFGTWMATPLMADYYGQRASAGLIITEGVHTSVVGRGWHRAPELFTSEHAESWKPVTDRVHHNGGRIFCQLWHCGRHSHSSFRDDVPGFDDERKKGVAPSAIPRTSESGKQDFTNLAEAPDIEVPRVLTLAEIELIPDEYRNCAAMAKLAGFDGVEIHSSNGFLLDTFLQSSTNHRTDEYGGESYENRFRLIGKVLDAVCTVFPSHRVGIRLSPNGAYNCMGSADNHDAYLHYIDRLSAMELGYLHITNGIGPPHGLGPTLGLDEIRVAYGPGGVIIANTDYDAASAEKDIASGNVDAVSFGRLFLGNPDLPERFAAATATATATAVEEGESPPKPPLNDVPDYNLWWSTSDKQLGAEGYTDFPKLGR